MHKELLAAGSDVDEAKVFDAEHEHKRRKETLVLKAQATCAFPTSKTTKAHTDVISAVSWSPPASAHAILDQSLLAVGHRSGEVTFWRYVSWNCQC